MDCTKLKADIERLREACDAFNAAVSAANDTGSGKIKCNEAMERTSELEDEVLRTYKEDAGKHNPELLSHFYYGEKIDGFHEDIFSTMKLSDSEVLVCGNKGETRILRKGEDGSWNYDSDSIDGFDGFVCSTLKLSDSEVLAFGGRYKRGETRILRKGEDDSWNYDGNSIAGFDGFVRSTLRLSDDEVLACGSGYGGETHILRRGEDGLWDYDSNSIDGFNNNAVVRSTLKLSDDEVLVCGGGLVGGFSKTRILRKSKDGSWSYDSDSIDGFDGSIFSTMKLSDSEVLVCGGGERIGTIGETRILRKGEDGSWDYDSNSIDVFSGRIIYSTLKLSDSEVLVCGEGFIGGESATCILHKSEDGLWHYSSYDVYGFDDAARSTLKLSDNEVLVCGNKGETRILRTDGDIDLDELKEYLPDIAAKKDKARTS